MEREQNSCLPTAIAFKQGLSKHGVWSEVVRYSWKDESGKTKSHAVTAYLYPIGKNQLWTYDYMGSYRIRAYTNQVHNVAQLSHWNRGNPETTFNAEYLK
jgi:hypothetical protein